MPVVKRLLVASVVFISSLSTAQVTGVPTTLERIETQTTAIQSQISDPAAGLRAVHDDIESVKQDVAATETAIRAKLQELDVTIKDINAQAQQIQGRLVRPPPAAHRHWVSPFWTDWETGGGSSAHIISPSRIVVLNPGDLPAEVSCTFFEANGTLNLDRGITQTVSRGGTVTCTSMATPLTSGKGWMLVRSDRPVLVYGWYERSREIGELHREVMHFFPVDCSRSEGVEFLCAFEKPKR